MISESAAPFKLLVAELVEKTSELVSSPFRKEKLVYLSAKY